MTYETFTKLAADYSAIPVARRLMADTLTPVSVFLRIRGGARHPFLLESVEGGEQIARYSFLGRDPYQVLRYHNDKVTLEYPGRPVQTLETGYYETLKNLTQAYSEPELPDMPRLTGGAVGYSSYDTIRLSENLPDVPESDLNLPDAIWAFYHQIYAFDHVKHQIVLINTVFTEGLDESGIKNAWEEAQASLDRMELDLLKVSDAEKSSGTDFQLLDDQVSSNISPDEFEKMVEKARSYIYEGDIFQVVLSQRFKNRYKGDRFMLYRALRMVNPSPYLFYLDFYNFALVGSSPEVLVQVQDGKARLLPIAGTRKRGATQAEDEALAENLAADPKELAEHIMLVDLGRNDLSRICEQGTVKLTKNKVIERYSHVMHIVSEVMGELGKESGSVSALMHCFPAGTVSGAPKVRAMEIIDELEPVKRGPYAGAVGYFDYSGNMDTCIAIRTMVATRGEIYIQAGAGIVADSVPEKEYEETVNKAKALVEALQVALKVNG